MTALFPRAQSDGSGNHTSEGNASVMPLRVITVNANGIRAAHRRGGLDWLAQAKPDVVCIQEVRATRKQLDDVLADSPLAKFHVAHQEAPELGRAGVAILTKREPHDVRDTFRDAQLSGLGRWIETDLQTPVGDLTVVSAYVHTGEAETKKQDEKYEFLASMEKRLQQLRSRAAKSDSDVLVCGDFNIARAEIDIKNWKGNLKNSGFLPEEREIVNRWFAKHWVDLGRHFGGEGPGPYTWWSWRGRGFDTDGGWRIDYQMSTPRLAQRATSVEVGKAPTYAERWSDHAPVTVTFR
jgi:exodeoxyribonuclease-3